jgi:hypothetical protein
MAKDDKPFKNLPKNAAEYINLVLKNMRSRKKARDEVREELIDHFELHTKDCATDEEKEQKAHKLISEFGDAKLLATLMRRAKKRCRPLWQKILVRSSIAALLIFSYLFICASRLGMGRPTIKINYAQWLTDQQRQNRDESLNAKPDIDKSAELLGKINGWNDIQNLVYIWPGDMNDAQRYEINNFLPNADEVINLLNKSLEKPYFWNDYNSSGPIMIEVNSVFLVNLKFFANLMPTLSSYRQMGYVLAVRSNWRAYSGDIGGAVDDLITLIRFSSYIAVKGMLVERLVSTGIESIAENRTIMLLTRVDIPPEQMKRLQDALSVSSAEHEFPISIEGEKAFWYDRIQCGFTDDGRGNGKILKAGSIYFVRDWKDAIRSFLTFSYPDRQEALAQVEKMFAESQRYFQITPWQMKSNASAKRLVDKNPFLWSQIASTAIERAAPFAWSRKTQREATLTILAVLRYQKEKGKYPDNLDELVQAGLLAKLPEDPYSPGPLTCKKTKDGFLLYSWGANLKDDDGQVARDEKGRPKRFADEGDWVFWPVEKN